MEIEWGPAIPNPGSKPFWLKVGEEMQYQTTDARKWFDMKWGWGFGCVGEAFRLPANHPYYLARSKGFDYWPGGSSAPSDWDGYDVLERSGDLVGVASVLQWKNDGLENDIIGYRRKAAPHRETVEDWLETLPPLSPQPIGSAAIPASYKVTRKVGEIEIIITGPDLAHILRSIREDGNDPA